MRKHNRGIAILETAAFAGMLLVILTGGLALWEYLRISAGIKSIAVKSLESTSAKPFRIISTGDFSDGLRLNEAHLESTLSTAVKDAQVEIIRLLSRLKNPDSEYFIQACFIEVLINSRSGAYIGPRSSLCPATAGDPGLLTSETTLPALESEILRTAPRTLGRTDAGAMIAVPDGSGSDAFLPVSVLAGIRIFASLEGTPASLAATVFRHPPYVLHDQIVMLRGDLL